MTTFDQIIGLSASASTRLAPCQLLIRTPGIQMPTLGRFARFPLTIGRSSSGFENATKRFRILLPPPTIGPLDFRGGQIGSVPVGIMRADHFGCLNHMNQAAAAGCAE